MEATPPEITEWDENTVHQLVEEVRVPNKDRILIRLRGGVEVEQTLGSREAAA